MGRPTKRVDASARPRLRELLVYLRRLKDEADATYATLSERTGPKDKPGYRGASTLSQAARGTQLPPLATALAYARAAGDPGDQAALRRVARARKLWKAAAVEKARPGLVGRGLRLGQVRTAAALGQGLARLRLRAGQPSLSAIEQATEADGHRVPRSTAHLILGGKVLPSREQLAALLDALDVTAADTAQWHAVRDKVENRLRPPAPARSTGYVCADADPAVQEYLDRRERDEEIKRRTGQIRPHEEYEDYEERMLERANQQAADDRRYWDRGADELDEVERESQAADQAAHAQGDLRAWIKAMAERADPR